METLTVRTIPIEQLRPADYNPRRTLKPSDKAYRKLKRSIEEFGLVEPLIWNEPTQRLVGGHLRLRILKELNYTEVPVSVVNLSEAREKALNVILNNREAQGRYDAVKLRDLLQELEPLPELPLTGFDLCDLKNLNLAPLPPLPEEEGSGMVEVTLKMSKECYENASAKIDALIREYDLEAHVRN